MKKIVILGATGSIGTQTIDVVRRLPQRFQIVGLSAYRNCDALRVLAAEFCLPPSQIACGPDADLVGLATIAEADMVVMAVAGATGIRATAAALTLGKDVALATKEVLVAAGEPITRIARSAGARLLPIDSEHSAIFQCLQGKREEVRRILLTASGGPFREWDANRISAATKADALAHPTWPSMGRKITIDSATMMNKGLEAIEARWLFDVPVEQIEVVIHPQSVIHSFVEFTDGSLLAQLGLPDMRLPILYALTYPDRVDAGLPRLDIANLSTPLTFEAPDELRFPCLRLAREAAAAGGTVPAVLNAANEAAVADFLDDKVDFSSIATIVERCIMEHRSVNNPTLDDIFEADAWACAMARSLIGSKASSN